MQISDSILKKLSKGLNWKQSKMMLETHRMILKSTRWTTKSASSEIITSSWISQGKNSLTRLTICKRKIHRTGQMRARHESTLMNMHSWKITRFRVKYRPSCKCDSIFKIDCRATTLNSRTTCKNNTVTKMRNTFKMIKYNVLNLKHLIISKEFNHFNYIRENCQSKTKSYMKKSMRRARTTIWTRRGGRATAKSAINNTFIA